MYIRFGTRNVHVQFIYDQLSSPIIIALLVLVVGVVVALIRTVEYVVIALIGPAQSVKEHKYIYKKGYLSSCVYYMHLINGYKTG